MLRSLRSLAATLTTALLLSTSTPAAAQIAAQNRLLKSDAIVPQRSHSLYGPYVDSNLQNKFWDFGGDAYVDTNRYVRLTQDRGSQAGWLWSRLELLPENFEILLEFGIDGRAAGHTPYGDGFAMWLTKERATAGPVFGNRDHFTGLGIMFDTFANSRHAYSFPRVMAITNDGTQSYDNARDGGSQEVAGCSVEIRGASVATKARLTYVKDVFLELSLHYEDWDEWETCFKVSNITIPQSPYLGFSAATGDVSDNHDIISVSSNAIIYKPRTAADKAKERLEHFPPPGSAAAKAKAKANKRPSMGWFGSRKPAKNEPPPMPIKANSDSGSKHSSSSGSGGGFFGTLFGAVWFLLKWAVIFGIVAAGGYAFMLYRKKKDAKRF